MRTRMVHGFAALLMLLTVLATVTGARADGVIVVTPPECDPGCETPVYVGDQLVVKQHHVDVTINDQLATTEIDQTFHNPNDWVAEGTYLFPVPQGATIDQSGVVTVNLEGLFDRLGDDARRRLGAQLLWSLTAIPRVTGLVVTSDGVPFTLPGARADGALELASQQGYQILSRAATAARPSAMERSRPCSFRS